jgi:hypothetical protein
MRLIGELLLILYGGFSMSCLIRVPFPIESDLILTNVAWKDDPNVVIVLELSILSEKQGPTRSLVSELKKIWVTRHAEHVDLARSEFFITPDVNVPGGHLDDC